MLSRIRVIDPNTSFIEDFMEKQVQRLKLVSLISNIPENSSGFNRGSGGTSP